MKLFKVAALSVLVSLASSAFAVDAPKADATDAKNHEEVKKEGEVKAEGHEGEKH
jgi:hypothetical protein